MALTPQEISNLIDTYIIDNNIQYISPAKMRYVLKEINKTIGQTTASNVTAQLPLIFDAFTNEFSINESSEIQDGYLSKENFESFNARIQDITAGTNVTIDKTDPLNPVISASGGGGGVGTLQEVTDLGNSTTNDITVQGVRISGDSLDIITNIGENAGQSNTGTSVTNIGNTAGQNNTGNSVTNIGENSGQENSGTKVTNIGEYAGFDNTLDNVINLGPSAQATATNQLALHAGIANTAINLPATATELTLRASASVETIAYLSDISGGGGSTDLSYTPSPTDGTVTSSTGTDATIPLADGTNAGLLSPDEKTEIAKINKTEVKLAENISKGQAVYISSANGTNIIVSKASNATEATSSKVLGLLETTGVTNDIVNVVTFELLTGLNTSSATVGDPVWLGTSGNLIFGLASKPVAPAHLVYIGAVSRVHATNGEIFINVQNGFEINEIHDFSDVSYSSPIDTDSLMIKDVTNSLWKRFTFANLKTYLRSLFIGKIINDTTASSSNTGVTTEVVMKTYEITGGTFVSGSKPNITIGSTKSSGSNAVYTMRIYAGTTSTFASATLIGTFATSSAFIRGFNFERRAFYFDGTTLKGYLPTTTVRTDITELSTTQWTGITLDPANSIFIFVTLQNASGLDTTRIDYVNITE